MNTTIFNKALVALLLDEGVYSNDTTDNGQETVYGISRVSWPSWKGWRIVDSLKHSAKSVGQLTALIKRDSELMALVSELYLKQFWLPLHCDELADSIASELFNTSVNMGINYGAKCLQRALNKLNRNQRDYPDLKIDGDIGPVTLKAYADYMATSVLTTRSVESCTRWLLKWMNFFQMDRYNDITDLHPEQEKYIPGWTDRA